MIQRRPGLVNIQHLAHLLKQGGLKLLPLVTVQRLWHAKTRKHILYKSLEDGLCSNIWQREQFYPLGEVIADYQDMFITRLRHR